MSLKNEIIKVLESNRSSVISGQELAKELNVSRAAVWKAINALRKEGYQIDASTNKGYTLSQGNDCMSEEGIRVYLNKKYNSANIEVFDEIDSTNTYAKAKSMNDGKHGDVIIANSQSHGKGRLGRSFFSPSDTGVYMSIILKPKITMSEATFFTIIAAVSVCRAVENLTDEKPTIKWVNDVFIDGKKICGILTEAVGDFESNMAESIIVGIGINVKTSTHQFLDEIKDRATSINHKGLLRNQLVAEVINEFMGLAEDINRESIIHEYKEHSIVLGREITYTKDEKLCKAKVLDINVDGNLIADDERNGIITLKSGEISIGSGNV